LTEATIIKHVRQACVLRDGYCRVGRILHGVDLHAYNCQGGSEWAHFSRWQRWKTMGQKDPAQRHCTQGSLMLCHLHHTLYDGKYIQFAGHKGARLLLEALTDQHANGPLRLVINGVTYEEEQPAA
jgi:hypothetical protein